MGGEWDERKKGRDRRDDRDERERGKGQRSWVICIILVRIGARRVVMFMLMMMIRVGYYISSGVLVHWREEKRERKGKKI